MANYDLTQSGPEVQALLDSIPGKAPQATTYTKTEVDNLIKDFITKSVNDLVNYYLKSDTYTKTEVNTLIAAIKQFTYEVVQTLPTASADTMNKIYLVPSADPQTQNVKDEYITISTESDGVTTYSWEQIGSTAIDLSGYYTSAQTDAAISTALSAYSTTLQMNDAITSALNTALASYSTTTQMNSAIASALASYYTKSEIDAALALKASQADLTALTGRVSTNEDDISQLQAAYAALTQSDPVIVQPSDTWPVANPTQNTIYRVIDRVNTPPQYYSDYMWNGTAMVQMAQYNNAIDAEPTAGSHNLVESGGVAEEIDNINTKIEELDITGDDFDEVEISSEEMVLKDDNNNYVAHADEEGIHSKDFILQHWKDGSQVSVEEALITGDADVTLQEDDPISILNSDNEEIVRIDAHGIHSPTIKEQAKIYDVYIIPSYGQSLAIGIHGGSTTFPTVEPWAYNENLEKTDILDMCQGIAEGFRLAKEENSFVLPNRTKVITFAVGTGGISVKNLSKGGSYGYSQLLEKITTAKQTCDNNGLTCIVPCIAWTQGEEDMRCNGVPSRYGTEGYEPTEYHNTLIKLIEDLNEDIKKITNQVEDVILVEYQTSSSTSYKRYPRISLEQGLADELSNKVYLVKPNYNVEYAREGASSDPGTEGLTGFEVHCPNKSYREMGNHYGIAAFEYALLKQIPSRVYPKSFFALGNKMVIRFNVPCYPLVLDTVNINNLPDGKYGFCVYNVNEGIGETGSISYATTTISSVEITDIDEITITFNRTPQAGETLTYGVNGDYWVNIDGVSQSRLYYEVDDGITKSGKLHGGRGCIRDSSPMVNEDTGAIFTNLYNWCRIFEYKF